MRNRLLLMARKRLVPAVPVASFTTDKTVGKAPLTVRCTDTSTGVPTSWAWDFGDGSPGVVSTDGMAQTHTFAEPGTYTVTLTVTNAHGSDSETATVTVDMTPPAKVSGLQMTARDATSITWTWTDPTDADFTKVRVYLNGEAQEYLPKGTETYTATGLTPATSYTFAVRTFDLAGNYGSVAFVVTSTTYEASLMAPVARTSLSIDQMAPMEDEPATLVVSTPPVTTLTTAPTTSAAPPELKTTSTH